MRAASLSSKKKKIFTGTGRILSNYLTSRILLSVRSGQFMDSFQTVHVLLNLHRTIHTLEQATIIFMKEQTVCYFHNYLIAYKMSENGQNVHYNFPEPRVLLSLSDQQSKNPNIFGLLSYKTHKANL